MEQPAAIHQYVPTLRSAIQGVLLPAKIRSEELSTTLLLLQNANQLFWSFDSIDRIAKFSAEEWDDLFLAIAKIVDCAKIFQLPEAMKVVDALIRSAQELLFFASSENNLAVDQRVCSFVSKQSNVRLLLRTYQTARKLIYRENLGISASHVLVRVMDVMIFCSEISCDCANAVGNVLLSEVYDDWIGIMQSSRLKIEQIDPEVNVISLIWTAASALYSLIAGSDGQLFNVLLTKNSKHERCAAICNMVRRSMHAPTIMALAEVVLKMSRSIPTEMRNWLCTTLHQYSGAALDVLHRVIGDDTFVSIPFHGASPPEVHVMELVQCVHHRDRGKVVWQDVSNLELGERVVHAIFPTNTIFVTELGLWFMCEEVRVHIDLKHVLSVQYRENVCEICFHTEIVSFGDLSVDPAATLVALVLNNPAHAQEFAADLDNKMTLLQNLDIFRLRTGINTSMQQIQDEYRSKLEAKKKGKTVVGEAMYERFGGSKKAQRRLEADARETNTTLGEESGGIEEGACNDWKSVSHSQSAAEPAQTSASFKESTLEAPSPARSPAVKTPQSSQRSDRNADSLPSSAPRLHSLQSPPTSKRSESQNAAKSPAPSSNRNPSTPSKLEPASPLKQQPSAQKMPPKTHDSVASDSCRGGDTTPSATPSSKMHPKTPAALVISAAMAAHDAATKEPVSVVDAAEDINASIIPQTLHFSQASAIKTPESAKKTAPAATAPVPKASDKHRQKVAENPAQATNAELPLAFSLQARDGQFLRFAADGAASLKAYPEGPSGNCLLQVVPGGSGMMKLKTNHGTFLSLTRDSSVIAVATGRTGFRVMSEGGKYVFTHESGKFLGVSAGQVCGLEKRQQERPQQDITSDFSVVTITEGASTAACVAAVATAPSKSKSKPTASHVGQPAAAATDPFTFDAESASLASSKRIKKAADHKSPDKAESHAGKAVPTKRGSKVASLAPAAAAATTAEDSDDDKPFKFPHSAEAAPSKQASNVTTSSPSAPVVSDVPAPRSRRAAAVTQLVAATKSAAAEVSTVTAPKRQRADQSEAQTTADAAAAVSGQLSPKPSDGKISGFNTRTSASEIDAVPGELMPTEATALPKTPSANPASKMHPKTPVALGYSAVSVVDAAEDINASIIPQTLHFSQASAIKTPESAKKTAPAATAPVPEAPDKHRHKVAEKPAQATNAELPHEFSLYAQVSPDTEFLKVDCKPHPALWARVGVAGDSEVFWIETALSRAQMTLGTFDFPQYSRKSRALSEWFGVLREITEQPLVAELLKLFRAGLLPISVAAQLGEKQRSAAFAAPHPLAWIDLCAPLVASSGPVLEKIFGYECRTDTSHMLRVVHRGSMDNATSWYRGRADFVQHGQLALLKEAFPEFFQRMPVGLHLTAYQKENGQFLLIPNLKSYSNWCEVVKYKYGIKHNICFVIFSALVCEPVMFAHPITDGSSDSTKTDAPFCVGGSGKIGSPCTTVSYNLHYKLYANLALYKVRIEIH